VRFLIATSAVACLLLAAFAAFPKPATAACGAYPSSEGRLARYAGKHGDTIALGRLIEEDLETGDMRLDVLTVYRGEAASPMEVSGVNVVGSCTGAAWLEPGERLIYVAGDRERYGPLKLAFPHEPGRGWLGDHLPPFMSLDSLLVHLGVLPETSSTEPPRPRAAPSGWDVGWVVASLVVFACLLRSRLLGRPTN
jgi:hypothetical protein